MLGAASAFLHGYVLVHDNDQFRTTRIAQGDLLLRQHTNEGYGSPVGLKLGLFPMRFVRPRILRDWAVQRLSCDYGSAEVARSFLREKKLDCNVAVGRASVDKSRMHVALGLESYLTIDDLPLRIRFARRVDGNLRVAHHDADRVEIMPVQSNGIARRDLDLVQVDVLVVKLKMVMRLGCEWNHSRSLRGYHQRKPAYQN